MPPTKMKASNVRRSSRLVSKHIGSSRNRLEEMRNSLKII
ncbi:unnamed protein product [Oikopleura dioica]|uniref:Uncharacterized protein n=1 Tax=Oikopleura dioica TaxID=34765 RepID=E4YR51_OIKDI|nr:unnamed protein product [Oikopleura dioica]